MGEGKAKDREYTAVLCTSKIKSLKSKVMEKGFMYELQDGRDGKGQFLPGIGKLIFALRASQQLPFHFSWSVSVNERAAGWSVSPH